MSYVGFDYTIDDMYRKIKLLHKQISKKHITLDRCNNYIEVLDEIKDRICKISPKYEDWMEDFSDLEISENYFKDITDEEIYEVVEAVENQLQRIALKFTIDLDEVLTEITKQQSPVNVQVNQSQAQHQIQTMNQTQIQSLVDDFKKEIKKSNPNKDKLVDTLKKISTSGATWALKKVVDLILLSL